MSEVKILVTGANGQIGQSLQQLVAKDERYACHFYSRRELDISDADKVMATVLREKPNYVINAAAYTGVDKAESEPGLAAAINTYAVEYLCTALDYVGGKLIHFSSDYVYDNELRRPIKEVDPTNPQSVYAQTKLAGDRFALAHGTPAYIIRTSWVYSPFGHNFLKTMLRLANANKKIQIVDDQIGAPTYALDIASAVMKIIDKVEHRNERDPILDGIYHCTNAGQCSWYEYAEAIFTQSNLQVDISPIPTYSYPTPAKRPKYSVLDNSRLQEVFDIVLPDWKVSLTKCLEELNQ